MPRWVLPVPGRDRSGMKFRETSMSQLAFTDPRDWTSLSHRATRILEPRRPCMRPKTEQLSGSKTSSISEKKVSGLTAEELEAESALALPERAVMSTLSLM